MLAKEVPEYTVRYVAKWSDMEADEYYYDGPTVDVWFHGNGGTFEGTNVYGTEETEGFGTPCIPGKAVGKRVSEITDPVYWNADPDNNVAGRKFLGWKLVKEVEKTDDEDNWYVEETAITGMELVDTATALAYVVPEDLTDENARLCFYAQWDGDDSDYYSTVWFDSYGGEFTYESIEWINDNEQKVQESTGCYCTDLKENNETIADQTSGFFMNLSTPTKNDDSGATFEGWVEFKVLTRDDIYNDFDDVELVSSTTYTTEQIMSRTVPSYDVVYAAKWSDMKVEDYYLDYYQFAINSNGGELIGTGVDAETGETFEISCMACEYGIREGSTFKDTAEEGENLIQSEVKACAEFVGWDLYKAEDMAWWELPVGDTPIVKDNQKVFYLDKMTDEETGDSVDVYYALTNYELAGTGLTSKEILNVKVDAHYYADAVWNEKHVAGSEVIENIVEATAEKDGSYEKVVYCECDENEISRETVVLAATGEKETHPELEVDMMVNVEASLSKVPEKVADTYETVADVEKALTKVAIEAEDTFTEDDTKVVVFEAKLLVEIEEGIWIEATEDIFPSEGVYATIPYPEGIDPDEYDFVLTHMIVAGEKAGEIEVLDYERTDDGLRAKFMSMSPVAIAYQEKEQGQDPDPTPVQNPFTDVDEDDEFYDAIMWAYENEITNGMTETTFVTEGECTRAQVVTFLWRAEGCPKPTTTNNPFTDISEKEYYYKAVLWAYENGITNGTSATTFSPDNVVTREQLITFIWRLVDEPETSIDNPFTDVKEGTYSTTAILWAYENGITLGKSAVTFGPTDACLRGQVVAFLYRLANMD